MAEVYPRNPEPTKWPAFPVFSVRPETAMDGALAIAPALPVLRHPWRAGMVAAQMLLHDRHSVHPCTSPVNAPA